MHGADVDEVGLPALPQAERGVCDLRPCLAGHEKNGMLLHQSPYLPTCKAKANERAFAAEEPSHTPRIIRFSV